MSYRVYMQLEKDLYDRAQDIGSCIIAYLDRRLNLPVILKVFGKNGSIILYVVCRDEEEARRIYDVIYPNKGAGVFSEVVMREGYRADRKTVGEPKNNPWRLRYYNAMYQFLGYALEKEKSACMGYGVELTRTIKAMGLTDP